MLSCGIARISLKYVRPTITTPSAMEADARHCNPSQLPKLPQDAIGHFHTHLIQDSVCLFITSPSREAYARAVGLGPSTRSSANRPVSVFSTLSGAAPVAPKPIRSLGRTLHWAYEQPLKAPGYKSVAQMMGTRPLSVTARAFLLYKQKRKWSK